MFKGSFVALVTPFENGQLNESVLRKLVEFQIENGSHGIVPCATTGEAPTLTEEEYEKIITIVVKTVNGRVPVIAGAGTNSTERTIQMVLQAKKLGVTAALVVSPYYNKPTQECIYLHFKTIIDTVDLPIVVYNIPSRTGVNITPQTMSRLAKLKNIVAIKEASGNLSQISEIVRLCGDNLSVLSGDDSLTLPILSVGGCGVISVLANILPSEMAKLITSYLDNKISTAQQLHHRLFPLFQVLFIETNPIPVKAAMNLMGMQVGSPRLPLCDISAVHLSQLRDTLKEYGLVKES